MSRLSGFEMQGRLITLWRQQFSEKSDFQFFMVSKIHSLDDSENPNRELE
jgi:hypothetical protein